MVIDRRIYCLWFNDHNSLDNPLQRIPIATTYVGTGSRPFSSLLWSGNSAKIIVPRSWLGKRVIAFLHSEYLEKHRRERKELSSHALLSNIIPFAGSGLLGYAMGFALKKILKWMLIIVGFLAGMFFVGVQLLQRYSYVNAVNWDYLP